MPLPEVRQGQDEPVPHEGGAAAIPCRRQQTDLRVLAPLVPISITRAVTDLPEHAKEEDQAVGREDQEGSEEEGHEEEGQDAPGNTEANPGSCCSASPDTCDNAYPGTRDNTTSGDDNCVASCTGSQGSRQRARTAEAIRALPLSVTETAELDSGGVMEIMMPRDSWPAIRK